LKPRLTHERVRGRPITIYGRTFEPEARVTTLMAREATLAPNGTRLVGFQFSRIRPTALIEHTPHGERHHRISDPTGFTLLGLAVFALALPVISNALARWLDANPK